MYTLIARNILAPIFDLSMGTKTMKCLKELEESQWWPRKDILNLQNQRLRQLITHAYNNVPYYRRIFDERALKSSDIECSPDLIKLPVLNKTLIRRNFDYLKARNVPPAEMTESHTSGSTGEPLIFYSTKKEGITRFFAASQRAFGWSGYKIGAKLVSIRLASAYPSTIEKIRETAKIFFERGVFFDVKAMSMGGISLFARKLEDFQPEFIRGYPSAIYLLARFLEREGKNKLRPKAIIATAEKVYGYQRDFFRKLFECDVYSFYSGTEAPSIASECSSHLGYHITAENIIVEIVDDQGKPVPLGEEGRILVTNLHNYAMPFIRYDIGDLGVISDQSCSCGRGLPLLAKLNGRISDVLLTKSGRSIPGLALDQLFLYTIGGIEQWQIVQESYEKVVVKIVLDREYPQMHLNEIKAEVKGKYGPILGSDMNISVEFVDQIPLTTSGKRSVIISNVLPLN